MQPAARPQSGAEPLAEPRIPPGPKGLPIVGVLPRIWRDPLGFFSDVAAECGGLARIGINRFTLYLLSDPDGIQQVLQGKASLYWKGEGLAAARTVMGSGLATSHGDHWRAQRRRIQPAFMPASVSGFGRLAAEATREVVGLGARDPIPQRRDVLHDASRITQLVLFRGLFGADTTSLDTDAMTSALATANQYIHDSAWSMLPSWVPLPRHRRFRKAMELLDDSVYRLIEQRRARPPSGDESLDLLGRLLGARDPETGSAMSDEMVRDEVMTMFVAGHDTTSAGIAWTLSLLAQHPEIADAVAAEVHRRSPDGAPVDADATSAMDLLGRCIQESLRIYPPGWIVVRTPREDVSLCGFDIPKDAPILISPWVVHRRPDLWSNPELFDPGRFALDGAPRHRFAYFPYGGGARTCIGNFLADTTMRATVAEIVRAYTLTPAKTRAPMPQPKTTLQPKGGVPLVLTPRANTSS